MTAGLEIRCSIQLSYGRTSRQFFARIIAMCCPVAIPPERQGVTRRCAQQLSMCGMCFLVAPPAEKFGAKLSAALFAMSERKGNI